MFKGFGKDLKNLVGGTICLHRNYQSAGENEGREMALSDGKGTGRKLIHSGDGRWWCLNQNLGTGVKRTRRVLEIRGT